nr:hypothetical protein [Tanacetum cinerariifolium]
PILTDLQVTPTNLDE